MSIKQEMKIVGETLKNDQSMLENAFRLEALFKRHKKSIISIGIALVVGICGYSLYDFYTEQKAKESSKILDTLLENPNDATALEALKKINPNLHALFVLKNAPSVENLNALDELKNDFVADLVRYSKATARGEMDDTALDSTALKDLATIQNAYVLLKEGNVAQAKTRLATIAPDSPLSEIKKAMLHVGAAQNGAKDAKNPQNGGAK